MADEDHAILRFADQWWRTPGAKEVAIVDQFGITPTRFYQRLAHLIRQPAAAAAEPVLVHRLQRILARRQARRHHTTGGQR
ncbi:hypothetical protein A6V29_04315 [Blastococcus sp. CCUG 61487]|nr:hypothetical protein A6V29_04315 [Blastococcus sp. CCUG 61487]